MALPHNKQSQSGFAYFSRLPAEVRFQTYGYLASVSKRLWLRESAYFEALPVGGELPGSAANYMFRCRYPDQVSCLRHWDLRHLRVLSTANKEDEQNQQDQHSEACIETCATLFDLRLVSRGFANDVATYLFTTANLWIQFDLPFLAFLQGVPVQQDLGTVINPTGQIRHGGIVENTTSVQPSEKYRALIDWLSNFRRLTFFVHETRLPDLHHLRIVLKAGHSIVDAAQRRQKQSLNRHLQFIITSFDEIYYPPAPAMPRCGGTGNLPASMLTDQFGVFSDVQRRALTTLLARDLPGFIRGNGNDWTKDYMYYKIDWDANFSLPTESGVEGCSYRVHGQYISWTRPSGEDLVRP